ncbi:kinase-like protein, partial [Aureobasidium melanogenum]
MSFPVPASNLTLEQLLKTTPKFYWRHSDGTRGPAVGIDYEPVPVQLGNSLDDLLDCSDKSRILLIQLVTADGKQDRVAAKIMKSPPNVVKLKNELNILRSLRHKHIVAVLGSFSHVSKRNKNKLEYGILVFPLAAQNLQDFLEEISEHNRIHQQQPDMTWSPHHAIHKLLPYFACLCKTVLFLHKQDRPIKHRDIKPANILIDRVDNVILADFDISKAYNDDKEAITYGSLEGTVMYSSKYVWKDSAKDDPEESKRGLEWDVISLGFVFLEMATVLFGKTLDEMRKPMERRSAEGSERVIYSEARAEIRNWLKVLRETATSIPHMVPDRFFHLSRAEPDYVRKFLKAIEDMISAEQNDDLPLKHAWMTFGCLSEHCPSPQSE